MKKFAALIISGIVTVIISSDAGAQPKEYNYDESKVPKFKLPDPLVINDGARVTSAKQWSEKRRGEIHQLFETHVYGTAPEKPEKIGIDVFDVKESALGGIATRKQISVFIPGRRSDFEMDILIYLPAKVEKPVPTFVGLNFSGNHSIHSDPGIRLSRNWMRPSKDKGVVENRATESSRGTNASRWPIEMILKSGYAVATIYCGDIDPDFHDEFQNGVHPLFYKPGQTKPAPDEWGTIGAWAWGLSRAMDYFENDKDVDHEHVAVLGHSRLGKTSLWAGASDERFALVISNNSGCGGAALSRRAFGETVKRINTSFPHWFCGNFKKYNDNEQALPVDQHSLVALIAPRPVYIASAEQDRWADPRGEFLSAKYAEPVYQLLGEKGLRIDDMPEVDKPANTGNIGYHIRTGKHDVTDFDWEQYISFADRHFGN